MEDLHLWHHEVIGEKTVEALKKNGFQAVYFSSREEASQYILNLIPDNSSIGVAGSATIKSLEILDELRCRGNQILDHNNPSLNEEEKNQFRLLQQTCDVFLSSSNAVTLDGKLVNMDGIGNRVAAMTFGPKKVLIAVGINKIVSNLDLALDRIQTLASPINNKRLSRPNPCVKTGICVDCQSPTRICNILNVIYKKPFLTDITVIVIGENLGY